MPAMREGILNLKSCSLSGRVPKDLQSRERACHRGKCPVQERLLGNSWLSMPDLSRKAKKRWELMTF